MMNKNANVQNYLKRFKIKTKNSPSQNASTLISDFLHFFTVLFTIRDVIRTIEKVGKNWTKTEKRFRINADVDV